MIFAITAKTKIHDYFDANRIPPTNERGKNKLKCHSYSK